jgi:hypothetical protein
MGCADQLPRRRDSGLSLVELLVALALGVVLAFASVNLLLRSKLSYLEADELARLQENGRYALRLLSRELSMAGYLAGELPGTHIVSSLTGSPCFEYMQDTTVPLEYWNDVSANGVGSGRGNALPGDCLLRGQHQAGSDMLLIRRTTGMPVLENGDQRAPLDHEAIYLRTAGQGVPALLQRGGSASVPTRLEEFLPAILFLRRYSRTSGDAIPTLCRKRQGRSADRMAPAECMVEGIEDLQLEFGIDQDRDLQADRFLPAANPAQLGNAVAVRIYLLVRSVHRVPGYTNAATYQLGSKRVGPALDGYYRRVMQTTVLLRNSAVFGP